MPRTIEEQISRLRIVTGRSKYTGMQDINGVDGRECEYWIIARPVLSRHC